MITALAHACFVVPDLQRSVAFYQDVLGLKPAFEFRNDQGVLTGLYLHVGGRSFIELFQGSVEPGSGKESYRHISLEAADLAETVRVLRARGADITDPRLGKDGSWQAWTRDPDGNRIELHQYTSESQQTAAMARLGAGAGPGSSR